MLDQESQCVHPLLEEAYQDLVQTLTTEAGFRNRVDAILGALRSVGLLVEVRVRSDAEVAHYGNLEERRPTGSDTRNVEPLQIEFKYAALAGASTQDQNLAKMRWTSFQPALAAIFEEHWRAREPHRAVWSGTDDSIRRKRAATVDRAVQSAQPVAHVRMDCDGFGLLKQRLGGGDQPANALMQRIATFIREALADKCLVFHPHGDEFALLFVGVEFRDVLMYLFNFLAALNAKDFRPADHTEAMHVGMKMAVAFFHAGVQGVTPHGTVWAALENAVDIDLKSKAERGFIQVVGPPPATTPLTEAALIEAALSARAGLAGPCVTAIPDALQSLIAQILVDVADGDVDLEQVLRSIAGVFILDVAGGQSDERAELVGGFHISRYITVAELCRLMLHVLLKRRFLGRGPLQTTDRVQVLVRRSGADIWEACVQRQCAGSWVDVLSFPIDQANVPLTLDVGLPWVPADNGVDSLSVVTRWLPLGDAGLTVLSPCLLVSVGSGIARLVERCRPWVADHLNLDDRPVTSGHLPDFWQSNLARIIVACTSNSNIRVVLLVHDNAAAIRQTLGRLRRGCWTEASGAWTAEEIANISRATTIPDLALQRFRDRALILRQIRPDYSEVLARLIESYRLSPRELSHQGDTEVLVTVGPGPNDPSGPCRDFESASFANVYPAVLRALRQRRTPRFKDRSGRELAELAAVRIHLQSPQTDEIPSYWSTERREFEEYYTRAFDGPTSLFGRRFRSWGRSQPVDQIQAARDRAAQVINERSIDRRIMIVTSEPPGNSDEDPLGLTCIHVLPRPRNDAIGWNLDFQWVWRSVEAIVGLPFSVYGSVRFSSNFVETLRARMVGTEIRLGTVAYIALSLHLYCDDTDLAIARRIDLDAQP